MTEAKKIDIKEYNSFSLPWPIIPEAKKFDIVVAMDNDSLIGIKEYGSHSLPWPMIAEDMNFFKSLTTTTETEDQQNAIIVGHNTWETLPNVYRNNKKRCNIVVTRNISTGAEICVQTFDQALTTAQTMDNIDKIYVIGGAAIYNLALEQPALDKIYLTHIKTSYPKENIFEAKYYFPLTLDHFTHFIAANTFYLYLISESEVKHNSNRNIDYKFYTYRTDEDFSDVYYYATTVKNPRMIEYDANIVPSEPVETQEYQYLNLVKHILEHGTVKQTRNAITRSIFGYQMRYDLSLGYPIYTVKKSFPKSIFEELMWMIRGQTDTRILKAKGVNIWNKNSSKEFLEKAGLSYEEGDIGPGYGFQMRHHGAKYIDCKTNYGDEGTDQLSQCINLIRNDVESRRIIIDLWNPSDVSKQSLPACHLLYNFSVDDGKLNCHLFQRSWDVFLGWNTTTAALLTYLLAHHCGLKVGVLVHSVSDAHLYQSHIDSGAVAKLLERVPRALPKLSFIARRDNIEEYEYNDMVLENYYPCPSIVSEMVA